MMGSTSEKYTQTVSTRLPSHILKLPNPNILNDIRTMSLKYDVPYEIILGIYLIETYFRRYWFRLIEYAYLILSLVLFLTVSRKIPNLTIGRFQLGIGTYLSSRGFYEFTHSKIINTNNKSIVAIVFQSLFWDNHINFSAIHIANIYKETKDLDYKRSLRYTGSKYNGNFSYGLLLEEICINLNKNNAPL